MSTHTKVSKLSIVSTPIGNLEDMTFRAITTLKTCDLILAEDTRRSMKLCAHFGISTPMQTYHAHSTPAKADALITQLMEGTHMALITDAGTPLISDPGLPLLTKAIEAGIQVEPIPGACTPIAALTVAGLSTQSFRFVGFIARKGSKRQEAIEAIAKAHETSIVFESPERINKTLKQLAELLPTRRLALCRELTKLHEEVIRGTADELLNNSSWIRKGEICLVVEGCAYVEEADRIAPTQVALDILEQGLSTSDASRELASLTSLSRKEAYQLLLSLKRTS